ncbi:universal stress protein [Nocardia higoensis]|uniref:Universal stress protein n=1 Tax=Nocardia higoensis TaxID=228599 RepID=A0ABS0D5T3_9NOCA|nr:universal stress protein [Nocardia higoensis]MBF6353845.1 universal stress protein [Nocardia higoensis]
MVGQRNSEQDRHTAPVVVGVDDSAASDLAVRWAAEVALARRRRLHLVHALDSAATRAIYAPCERLIPSVTTELRAQGVEYLAAARQLAVETAPGLTVDTEFVEGSPAEVLTDRSASAMCTVIGTGNAGVLGYLGSTVSAVVAYGRGAVVVVRAPGGELHVRRTGPVVVGIDGGGEHNQAAIGAAFAEAAERRATLIAVHCWSDLRFEQLTGLPDTIDDQKIETASRDLLAEQLAGWDEKYPQVRVARKAYLSGPRHHLIEWSKPAQLVVVGSRGRGGFRRLLLGSTSNALVQQAHCPVMVVHPGSGAPQ